MKNWLTYLKQYKMYWILVGLCALNIVVYATMFGFRFNNDSDSFMWTIERFRGIDSPFHPNRYLNPLYPIIGATLLRPFSPAHVLTICNIAFYVGIVLLTYGLVRRVFKNNTIGFITALLVVTAYPVLRYGLTLVQDIGGWFWFVLTVYAGWRWWEGAKDKWLYVAGLATALGMLTKESGAMAALFVGCLFLFKSAPIKQRVIYFCKFSIIPFIVLLINQYNGYKIKYSSAEWFVWNWKMYAHDYTMIKWLGINFTTYNLLWVFIFLGTFYVFKNYRRLDRNIKVYLWSVLVPSFSYLAWPVFLTRTVFISAWFFLPLAAYGIFHIYSRYQRVAVGLLVVIMVVPYVLQNILGYVPVFLILEKCHYQPGCSWTVFREARPNLGSYRIYSDQFLGK